MTKVTHADDNGAQSASGELDDVTARILYPGMADQREEASSEERPSHQFRLSREELARDHRRLSIH